MGGVLRVDPVVGMRLRMASLLLHPRPGLPAGVGNPAAGGPAAPGPGAAGAVVEWFGAMQAQDLASGLWSLGSRLPGSTKPQVEAALERGEVLRTWPMRGTIHLVPARDAHWMLEVLGARALAGAARRREFLGLSEDTAERAVQVLGEAVGAAGRLTRAECIRALTEAGIMADGNYAYHLLWYASQRAVLCIGPNRGTEQTFVRLDQWVPDPHRLEPEEALATIAVRYFRSHGPAPVKDLAGWIGFPVGQARRAIAAAGDELARVESDDGAVLYLDPAVLERAAGLSARPVGELAQPGFDEYLLGFKDRSWMADAATLQAVIPGGNGVFQSTIVRDGRVVAVWKRTVGAASVRITVRPLARFGVAQQRRAEQALGRYADYLQLPAAITWAEQE